MYEYGTLKAVQSHGDLRESNTVWNKNNGHLTQNFSEGKMLSRHPSCCNVARNLAVFYSYCKNLSKTKCKSNILIYWEEATSMQHNIESVVWIL